MIFNNILIFCLVALPTAEFSIQQLTFSFSADIIGEERRVFLKKFHISKNLMKSKASALSIIKKYFLLFQPWVTKACSPN